MEIPTPNACDFLTEVEKEYTDEYLAQETIANLHSQIASKMREIKCPGYARDEFKKMLFNKMNWHKTIATEFIWNEHVTKKVKETFEPLGYIVEDTPAVGLRILLKNDNQKIIVSSTPWRDPAVNPPQISAGPNSLYDLIMYDGQKYHRGFAKSYFDTNGKTKIAYFSHDVKNYIEPTLYLEVPPVKQGAMNIW